MSDVEQAGYSDFVKKELIDMFAGDLLGSGMTRKVYAMKHNQDLVVKVEDASQSFQNICEYKFWEEVQYAEDIARWFAPVIDISSCGCVLIMRRTKVPTKQQYPTSLPYYMVDTKFDNFGLLGRRIVCHDYGSMLFNKGLGSRMRKIHWW